MKMKPTLRLTISAVAVAVLASSAANAAIVQYTFDPGSYYDFSGGSSNVVTGSFDYDTVDETFSNVVYDRGGTIFTVASSTGPGSSPDEAYFGDTTSDDYDVYQFANSLAAGGTDVITSGDHPGIFVSAGGSVTSGFAAPAPEPATWAMMLTGFGLAGAMMRRRGASLAA